MNATAPLDGIARRIARLVLLGLALAMIATGCVAQVANAPTTSCGPTTCTGCCNGTACVPLPDETQCGTAGAACAACNGGDVCTNGICGPASCLGCVDPSTMVCEAGTNSAACGTGGILCVACASGTTCVAGRCASTACTGCTSGGACETGNVTAACGAGGEACVPCSSGQSCEDGACVTPTGCGPTTCADGCCDQTGTCQPGGQLDSACGMNGATCETCSGTQMCVNSACTSPCGPDNCATCCDASGTCVMASDPDNCGLAGGSCMTCASGDSCSSGVCTSASCSDSCTGCCTGSTCSPGTSAASCGISGGTCSTCASGQSCVSGVCELAPSSLWDFVVTTGTVPATDASGASWDSLGGLPDPYVEVDLDYGQADGITGYSIAVDDTLSPSWSSSVVLSGVTATLLLEAQYMEVWDSDGVGVPAAVDDSMGFCSFAITEADFSGTLHQKTCSSSSVGVRWQVKWKILPHS